MPRTAAKITQADIARAVRAVKQVMGSAQVILNQSTGEVRVTPLVENPVPERVELDEPIDEDEEIDL